RLYVWNLLRSNRLRTVGFIAEFRSRVAARAVSSGETGRADRQVTALGKLGNRRRGSGPTRLPTDAGGGSSRSEPGPNIVTIARPIRPGKGMSCEGRRVVPPNGTETSRGSS